MNKWPLPNSVRVINNASIHRVDGIREMVQEHGARLVYLPAYSPDFNPIKLAFSSIKAWLRTNRNRINTESESIYEALWEAVFSVTQEDVRGWFKHCGYE